MKVKDIMTERVISIDINQPLQTAIKLMNKYKISRLLVKDEGNIVGIITERDIAERAGFWRERKISSSHIYVSSAYTENLISIHLNQTISTAATIILELGISSLVVKKDSEVVGIITKTDLIRTLLDSKHKISKYMKRPITVWFTSSLLEARRIMLDNNVKKLPVLLDSKLIGIITEGDIARTLIGFRKISEGKHLDKKLKKLKIEDAMTRDVITVTKDTTVGDVVRLMLKKDISCLPVVEDEKLVGIVTKTDLLKVLV